MPNLERIPRYDMFVIAYQRLRLIKMLSTKHVLLLLNSLLTLFILRYGNFLFFLNKIDLLLFKSIEADW